MRVLRLDQKRQVLRLRATSQREAQDLWLELLAGAGRLGYDKRGP
jgi:hypothetical protein